MSVAWNAAGPSNVHRHDYLQAQLQLHVYGLERQGGSTKPGEF
jgi:hypothetical protein